MTKLIFKFEIMVEGYQSVMMPKDADILCTDVQYGKMCLWALVDPKAKKESGFLVVVYLLPHLYPLHNI